MSAVKDIGPPYVALHNDIDGGKTTINKDRCSSWSKGAPWWRRLILRQTYHRNVYVLSEDYPGFEMRTEFGTVEFVAQDTLRQECERD